MNQLLYEPSCYCYLTKQLLLLPWGFPHSSVGKKKICLQCRKPEFNIQVGNILWRRKWQPTPVFLLENPVDRGAWQTTVHGIARVGHDLGTKPPPLPGLCLQCRRPRCDLWVRKIPERREWMATHSSIVTILQNCSTGSLQKGP